MTTHPTLEQRAKLKAEEILRECGGCIEPQLNPNERVVLERHLASFARESANAAAESMREACIRCLESKQFWCAGEYQNALRELAPKAKVWL